MLYVEIWCVDRRDAKRRHDDAGRVSGFITWKRKTDKQVALRCIRKPPSTCSSRIRKASGEKRVFYSRKYGVSVGPLMRYTHMIWVNVVRCAACML